jgi:D-serine deaminase-like pyridoxal phosphate-dependent protein
MSSSIFSCAGRRRPVLADLSVVDILVGGPVPALADVQAIVTLATDREFVAVSVDGLPQIDRSFHTPTLGARISE